MVTYKHTRGKVLNLVLTRRRLNTVRTGYALNVSRYGVWYFVWFFFYYFTKVTLGKGARFITLLYLSAWYHALQITYFF